MELSIHSNREHILSLVTLGSYLLKIELSKSKADSPGTQEAFPSLCISHEEAASLLYDRMPLPAPEQLREECDRYGLLVEQKTAAALEKGIHLKFIRLITLFDLVPFEIRVLNLCLLAQVDRKYSRIFGYLNNDIEKCCPTAGLLLDMLCNTLEEKVTGRSFFSGDAPLFQSGLLEKKGDQDSLLSKEIKMNDWVAEYLLEGTYAAGGKEIWHIHPESFSLAQLSLPAEAEEAVSAFLSYCREPESCNVILSLRGLAGCGNEEAALAICFELGLYPFIIDLRRTGPMDRSEQKAALEEALWKCHILGMIPVILGADPIFSGLPGLQEAITVPGFFHSLSKYSRLIIIAGTADPTSFEHPGSQHLFDIGFDLPSYEQRREIWENSLAIQPLFRKEQHRETLDMLSGKFLFTPYQIRKAVKHAAFQAHISGKEITVEQLYEASRDRCNKNLGKTARKIVPLYKWDDIILPPEQKEQLKEIVAHIEYKEKVYNQWGFSKKVTLGKGLAILFHGVSGTGKTMAAEVIAGELQLDLYKVNISTIVSKYIGETEKNLQHIFDEAQLSNSILFFDEADALFGKRTEVKDSHDRYANIEVGFLLQKLEEYTGVVIMATNLFQNFDDAFVRRMHFQIEFPAPDEEHRLKIWETIFPDTTPRAEDIDFPFLAKQLDIVGGNIKNIALSAAFLAARRDDAVSMTDIIKASKREFQKIGKLCLKQDFGKYYEFLQN